MMRIGKLDRLLKFLIEVYSVFKFQQTITIVICIFGDMILRPPNYRKS